MKNEWAVARLGDNELELGLIYQESGKKFFKEYQSDSTPAELGDFREIELYNSVNDAIDAFFPLSGYDTMNDLHKHVSSTFSEAYSQENPDIVGETMERLKDLHSGRLTHKVLSTSSSDSNHYSAKLVFEENWPKKQ